MWMASPGAKEIQNNVWEAGPTKWNQTLHNVSWENYNSGRTFEMLNVLGSYVSFEDPLTRVVHL